MNKTLVFIVAAVVVLGAIFLITRSGNNEYSNSPSPTVSLPIATIQMSSMPTPMTSQRTSPTVRPSSTPTKTPTPMTQVQTVTIANFQFSPATLTVKQGTQVVFHNTDTAPHTATELNGAFNSGTINLQGNYTLQTASLAPGTYEYRCSFHPSMRGTLVIQ